MAWRVADAVISEIPLHSEVKRIAEYFAGGITWKQLQCVATRPLVENGLGLFALNSRQYQAIFAKAPGGIVENRPESDMLFLRFLGIREHVLHLAASRDVDDRNLAQATKDAVAIMGDLLGRAHRIVAAEVLHRSLYLHFWVNKHNRISGNESLEDLAARARAIMQHVALSDETMERMGCSAAHLAAHGWARPSTWVELASLLAFQDEAVARAHLPDMWSLHSNLVAKGTAHLALVVHNIMRTSWIAGAVLHSDPPRAQAAAESLLRHLDSTAPVARTSFEKHVADNEELIACLTSFASRNPPVCVWQGGGAYKLPFQFLALRFASP